MLLKVLSNTVFEDCHIEAYSFWIKKRVTVFEYGTGGKIKLGIEPLDEQGALIDLTVRECEFSRRFGRCPDAIFFWRAKNSSKLTIAFVVAREKISDNCHIKLLENAHELKEILDIPVTVKLVLALKQQDVYLVEKLKQQFSGVFVADYDSYIGRVVEDFIKGRT